MIRTFGLFLFIFSLVAEASTPYATMDDLMKDFQKLDQQSPEHKCLKEGSYDACEKLMLKFNKAVYYKKMGAIISKSYNVNNIKRYIKITKRTYAVTVYKNYTKLNKAKKRLQIAYRYRGLKDRNAIDFKSSYLLKSNMKDMKNFIKYASIHTLNRSRNFAVGEKEKRIFEKLKTKKLLSLYRSKNSTKYYLKAYELSRSDKDIKRALSLAKPKELQMIAKLSVPSKYTHEAKVKLVERYRKKDNYKGYLRAYNLLHQTEDIKNTIRVANEGELRRLMDMDLDSSYLKEIKSKYLSMMRSKHSFDGYLLAYKVSKKDIDFQKASVMAKDVSQIIKIEKIIFSKIKSKRSLFDISFALNKPRYGSDNTSGGFGSQSSQYGYIYISGKLSAGFDKQIPFYPQFGIYEITVKLKIYIPRNRQLRSKWLGNEDTSDNLSAYTSVVLELRPPYRISTKTFSSDGFTLAYFDRGIMGGFTAKWPSGNARVEIYSVNASFVVPKKLAKNSSKNENIKINFHKLKTFDRHIYSPQLTLAGSYNRGVSMINNFANNNIGSYKNYNTSSSRSSTSSTGSATRSSTVSSSNSSRKQGILGSGGVRESYFGGYKSSKGHKIYIIKCNDGGSGNAFYEDGYWKDGTGSNYGGKYRGMSLDSFAKVACGE